MKITYNASPKVALICPQAHFERWSKFYSIASGIIARELALLIDDHKKKSRLLELSGIFDEIKVQHYQDHCMTKENEERRDRASRELCQIIRKTMPKDYADALTDYIYIIKDDLPYIMDELLPICPTGSGVN